MEFESDDRDICDATTRISPPKGVKMYFSSVSASLVSARFRPQRSRPPCAQPPRFRRRCGLPTHCLRRSLHAVDLKLLLAAGAANGDNDDDDELTHAKIQSLADQVIVKPNIVDIEQVIDFAFPRIDLPCHRFPSCNAQTLRTDAFWSHFCTITCMYHSIPYAISSACPIWRTHGLRVCSKYRSRLLPNQMISLCIASMFGEID